MSALTVECVSTIKGQKPENVTTIVHSGENIDHIDDLRYSRCNMIVTLIETTPIMYLFVLVE